MTRIRNEHPIAPTTVHPELSQALTGTVVLPGDPGWDVARSGFNLLDDQHPAETWACLRAIKARYDAGDLFVGNHHIPPLRQRAR